MAKSWTPDQRARRAEAEAGLCVVANMHKDRDEALIAWARDTRRFMRVDQWSKSEWANPIIAPDDGNRDEVLRKFASVYLPNKNKLLAQIDSGALRGKVLGCWCHPLPCHGHILAARANGFVAEGTRQPRLVAARSDLGVDAFFDRVLRPGGQLSPRKP